MSGVRYHLGMSGRYYLDTGEVPKDVVQVEGKAPRIFGAGDYAQLYTY